MPPPGGRRLAVDAHLDLTIDGHPVAVRGDGGVLHIEVDSAQTAYRLFRSRRPGRALVRALTDTLDALGVDVVVRVGGRDVARVGPAAGRGRLTALGLPAVSVARPRGRAVTWGLVLGAAVGVALAVARRGRR